METKLTERNEKFQMLLNDCSQRADAQKILRTPRQSKASAWLKTFLANGPKPAKEIVQSARGAGHRKRTLMRAKKTLGVTSEQIGKSNPPHWIWILPPDNLT